MKLYCGLDVSNKSTSICVIDEEREICFEKEVATDAEALGQVFRKLRKQGKLTCVVEAAPLAEYVCKVVENTGHKIEILCPRQARAVTQTKKKTDQLDARKLAEVCRTSWYTKVHRKSEGARDMRSLLVARKQLVEGANRIASSIRGLLRSQGIKLVASTDDTGFENKVLTVISELNRELKGAIKSLLSTWSMMQKEQRKLYKKLGKMAKKDETCRRLMTIPGVGPATAQAFVATIDDPQRFSSQEKVSAYLGLVPSVYQSGETEYRGRITKEGDRLLRWLLVEAAHVLLTRSKSDCQLQRWGLELQRTKGVGKARVAVARKLACLLYKMWKSGETFQGQPA